MIPENIKLTNIECTQSFLPENHPDKQNEWIPKVGDWVKRSWTDGDIDYFEIKSFDKDRNKIFVDYSKYYRNAKVLSNSSDETFGINGDGRVKDTKALPHEIPDDFILPEKWCVKTIEINEPAEVYKWRNERYFAANGYIHNDSKKWWDSCVKPGYTEITLEQFRKYVLKKSCVDKIVEFTDNTGSMVYNTTSSSNKYYLGIDLDEEEKSSEIHIPELTRHNKTQVKVVADLNYPNITINLIPKESKKVNLVTIKQTRISLK